jgi:hypothetical protein
MTKRMIGLCLIALAVLISGCIRDQGASINNKALDQPLVIRPDQSPANGDSRQPDLNATPDGRIILSWVEKLNDKRYSLRRQVGDQWLSC